MAIRIAINWYWRIWRNFHRQVLEQSAWIEVVAINTRSEDIEMRAHLLKYDSIHWMLESDIQIDWNDIITWWLRVKNFSIKDASQLPWKEMWIDIVLESTWKAGTFNIAQRHITSWASRVLVSAPMKDDTKTIVIWANENELNASDKVLSNASCTTNCIAPPLKVLNDSFWINFCFVNSIHSFTSSQNLLDNSWTDLRRSRSAVQSVIPTSSWAMKAIWKVVPDLAWKIDGLAIRVPIATSSVCECVIHFEKEVSVESINEALRKASMKLRSGEIIWIAEAELVSIDFKTDTRSCILDPYLTKVDKSWKHAQILLWYDNEWAYVKRLVDVSKLWMSKKG